ncbi:cold shock domain-containing protein [Gynuella sunshinyii]|uniref:Cold shock protein n=1 Tax=Gynuella sunshinyii YC6258 TaxID=1445510 RepID=A0A0C5VKE0_9GAMM|nr:cold shock domain-containing protein [Gynuella sunshinyii]AJQ94731.1 cold shock protein [Gynuella sunshinyii YC6258]
MKGKISQWKDDKGFGFIQPDDGSEKLFFHISSVETNARRPQVGDYVFYESMRDSQQRLRARNVIIQGLITVTSTKSASKRGPDQIEGPKKGILDYISILVILGSIIAAGFEFYHSRNIESTWPYGVPAIIFYFILNRQKKPKEKSFKCVRCGTLSTHNVRTIRAWNNGFNKFYCQTCHHQWLKDKPVSFQNRTQSTGCLGVVALIIMMPVLGSIAWHQWMS